MTPPFPYVSNILNSLPPWCIISPKRQDFFFEQLCHLDNWSSHFILWNNFFEGLFLRSWWRWEWGTKVSSHSLTFQLFSVNVSKVKHNFIKCKKIYHHQQQQCWTKPLKLCCWISDDIELILNVIFQQICLQARRPATMGPTQWRSPVNMI